MLHKVIVQFSGIVVGRAIAAVTQAFTIVLLARWAAPSEFGTVMAVQAVLGVIATVISFGLPQYISVLRARKADQKIISGIFRYTRVTSLIASALCVFSFLILTLLNDVFLLFLPLAVALGFQRNSAVWDAIIVADDQVALFSSNLVYRRAITLALFATCYYVNINVIFGYCNAVLVAAIYYNVRMRRNSTFKPTSHLQTKIKPILSQSLHFWIDAMSGMLRQLDIVIIGILLGPTASGFVAVPSKIASPLMLLPSSFATLILPRVSAGNDRAAREGVSFSVAITFIVGIFLGSISFFLSNLVTLLLGSEYLPAVPITQAYFIGFTGLTLIYTLSAVLQGLGYKTAVGRNSLAFSILTIILIGFGAYYYGLEAAAVGYAVGTLGQAFVLVVICVLAFRSKKIKGSANPIRSEHHL